MILLAISGGPDSMYLLYKYRKRKIVVAHVNYHLRDDSNIDEQIVRDFCTKYRIPFEVLNVKTKAQKNLQNWARTIRYQFFVKVAKKYNIKKILIAHHKDDFLETALMQQKSNRNPKYFGIKQKNYLYGLKIVRPLLHKINKRQIERFLNKHEIKYAIDSSNFTQKYTRNKIRADLSNLLPSERQKYYEWFKMSNKILVKKTRKVAALYKKWKKTNYNIDFFNYQKKFKEELIFELIHQNFSQVKLSKNKIKGIIEFISGKESDKTFKLNDLLFLKKNKRHLQWE